MYALSSAPTAVPVTGQMSYAGMIVIGLLCCLVFAIVAIVIASIVQKKNQHTPSTEGSCFDGNFWQRLGWTILARLITWCTLGIAYPAAVCMLLRWECCHTVVNGRRMKFTGTGGQLFGKYILWWLLTVVTFGIFGFWLKLNMKRWVVKHTVYADDHTGAASRFTGGLGGYWGIRLLAGLLTVCTLGIGSAWAQRMIINWEISHTYISGTRLGFDGRGGQLFGKYLLWGLLSVVTFSIFALFIPIKFLKWQYKHVGAAPVEEVPSEKKAGVGAIFAVIGIVLALALLAGGVLGIYLLQKPVQKQDIIFTPAPGTDEPADPLPVVTDPPQIDVPAVTLEGTWMAIGQPTDTGDEYHSHFADAGYYIFGTDSTFRYEQVRLAKSDSWYHMGGGGNIYDGTYDYDGTTLTLHYTTYYEFYFNEELGFEDTRPVEMDATEQFQFQLDPDGLPTNISEHPRLGQLVIFEPRNTEDPITQLLAMITQYG